MIRRYERERPGELIHVDIKKLGKIPDGPQSMRSKGEPFCSSWAFLSGSITE